jgi:hypothetical protein
MDNAPKLVAQFEANAHGAARRNARGAASEHGLRAYNPMR